MTLSALTNNSNECKIRDRDRKQTHTRIFEQKKVRHKSNKLRMRQVIKERRTDELRMREVIRDGRPHLLRMRELICDRRTDVLRKRV